MKKCVPPRPVYRIESMGQGATVWVDSGMIFNDLEHAVAYANQRIPGYFMVRYIRQTYEVVGIRDESPAYVR